MESSIERAGAHNFRVLASLVDLLRQLTDHYALVGRCGSRIVINLRNAPLLCLGALESHFLPCYLASECGQLSLFSGLALDVASETALLDASPLMQQTFADFADYPALRDVRRLVELIPEVPPELADHYDGLQADYRPHKALN